jgi:predicted nucleic acid-binding protein
MIVVDSSVWVALFNAKDKHHERANKELSEVIKSNEKIIVSDFVVLEVTTVLLERVGRAASARFLDFVFKDRHASLAFTGNEIFYLVVKAFPKIRRKLSFVDISLILLAKGIRARLMTYDKELGRVG